MAMAASPLHTLRRKKEEKCKKMDFAKLPVLVQWAAKVMTPAPMYFLWKQGS